MEVRRRETDGRRIFSAVFRQERIGSVERR
jgi:hypothetical protein